MATKIYDTDTITLFDGQSILLTPLKIKFLREFMDIFTFVKDSKDEDDALFFMVQCVRIALKQYLPTLDPTVNVEDLIDVAMMYKILEISAGIEMGKKKETSIVESVESSKSGWAELDLAKLEAEAFLVGIWKDYQELEESLSMPELLITLNVKRDGDYRDKKFLASIQGVDLDSNSDESTGKEWEDLKARVFSRGQTSNSNDIVSLQGQNAVTAGFGIGMGLDYEVID
jgi:hypothetical protein